MERFQTQSDIDEYLAGEKIQCLECGKWFLSLGTHMSRIHGMTANDYRDKFGLPRSTPLAGQSTRQTLSNQMVAMRQDGLITNAHLSDAARKIDYSSRADKKTVSDRRQREATHDARFDKNKLPAGAASSTGRNMGQAREYQRAYRALKNGDSRLMDEYKARYGS